jgi:hypothetical protein
MQSSRRRALLGLGLLGAAIVLAVAVEVSRPGHVDDVSTDLPSTTTRVEVDGGRTSRTTDTAPDTVQVPPSVLGATSERPSTSAAPPRARRQSATTTTVARRPKTTLFRPRNIFAALFSGVTTTTRPRTSAPVPAAPATVPPPAPTTAPPATVPPTTAPPTTAPPVTDPPTTAPPVTDPPTTAPPVTDPPPPLQGPLVSILQRLGLPLGG